MGSSRPLVLFTTILLLFTAFSSAFPWPKFLPEIDSLVVRQNNNDDTSSTASKTASSSSPSETGSNSGSASGSVTGSASRSATGSSKATGSGSKTGSGTTSSKTSKTSYDARLPAGGVSLVTPAVSSGAQYYKIGNDVTFAWNFTSLSASPTAINVMASCSVNNELYTIAMNQSVDATSVVWDTGSYQSTAAVPFPVASYTLIIYDADSSISAVAQAGYLGTYNQYTFGMYTPQAYTPLNEFVCATCSGALTNVERNALSFLFGMGVVTVLSFTWFIGGLNVIW